MAFEVAFEGVDVDAEVDVVVVFDFEMGGLEFELWVGEGGGFLFGLGLADDAEVGVGEAPLDGVVPDFFFLLHEITI